MKTMITKAITFACISSLMLACQSQTKKEETTTTVTIDKDQIKKEIQAKETEFATTYNNGVLKNIGYYADDATTFYQNRKPLVGKDSILAFLQSDVVGNTDKIAFTTNEVFVSNDGNMVVEVGSFTVVDSTNTPFNTGNYITLFEKRNGSYVAVRDMSASDRPIR